MGAGGEGGEVKYSQLLSFAMENGISSGLMSHLVCLFHTAAPTALHTHGIAKGKTVTSHPSVKDKLDGMFSHDIHFSF